MSTLDLPRVPRITLADLRRVNGHVVLVALVVVLVAWTTGLVASAGVQARQHAELVEHQRQVAHRVHALSADWRTELAFLDTARDGAVRTRLESIEAERAAVVGNRDVALADAAAALASSAGKVDDAHRAELESAVGALAAPETVYSRVVVATGEVSRLTGEVAAAEAAWNAEQARRAAEAATRNSVTPVSHQSRSRVPAPPPAQGGGTVQEVGEAALRALPGNAGVSIHWDDPDLSGHLGAVWSGNTSYIMVNGSALAGNPGKTRDVVRHEIAHIYQGRLAAAYGLSWGELGDRMAPAFGDRPQEKAADCVAQRFGASWTHYTSDCSSADKQAWVDAMIGGYLP